MIVMRDVNLISNCGGQEITTLKDVNLTIKDGDFIAITDTGSQDKYCLFNLIGALDVPTSGRVLFEKTDISAMSERDLEKLRLNKIGFVFKTTFLMPNLTVRENIEVLLKEAGVPKKERSKRAVEALQRVGMADKKDSFPADLNTYEQKAVGIARALANRPKILLVNEPPLNPAPDGRTAVKLLKELNKGGQTIVITTDSFEVASYAKIKFVIEDGMVKQLD